MPDTSAHGGRRGALEAPRKRSRRHEFASEHPPNGLPPEVSRGPTALRAAGIGGPRYDFTIWEKAVRWRGDKCGHAATTKPSSASTAPSKPPRRSQSRS